MYRKGNHQEFTSQEKVTFTKSMHEESLHLNARDMLQKVIKCNKELLSVCDNQRESKSSWKAILLDMKKRGLEIDCKFVITDGNLNFGDTLA